MANQVAMPAMQQASLFKIKLDSEKIKKLKASSTLQETVTSIVQLYDSQAEESSRFKEPIELDEQKLATLRLRKFTIRWYVSTRKVKESGAAKTLTSLAAHPNRLNLGTITEHHLIFFYKAHKIKDSNKKITGVVNCIFVLATDKANLVVRPFVDYEFPSEMARRICFPVFHSKNRINLSGTALATNDQFKQKVTFRYSALESLSELIKGFDTELKPHSTLYTLEAFKSFNDKEKKEQHPLKVTVGEMYLRFHHSFNLNDHLEICHHLLKIETGEELEERDSAFEYLDHIKRVPEAEKDKIDTLDTLLIGRVYEVYSGGRNYQLEFYHHHYQDYFRSTLYVLREKNKRNFLASWKVPPTANEVIEALREHKPGLSLVQFYVYLKSLKFDFKGKGKQKHQCSLVTFFKGEVVHEGLSYFYLDGKWCRVEGEYYSFVQNEFLLSARETFLSENDEGYLPLPWVNNKEWYQLSLIELNKLYTGKTWAGSLKKLHEAKFCYVNATGVVQNFSLDRAFFDQSAFKSSFSTLKTFLKENVGRVITEKDLEKAGIKDGEKVLGDLKQQKTYVGRALDQTYFIRQDPSALPASLKAELGQPLLDLLEIKWKRFESFREKEADYNRDYFFSHYNPTGKPFGKDEGYLVFDQVFVSEELKIELFDVAYYTPKKTYLYHVKAGFGQKTRDACSQIRNAAAAFESARKIGGHSDILSAVFDQIYQSDSKSLLTQKVKEQLQAFGGNKATAKKNFIDLFKENRLVFVYAFLDSAVTERDLGLELKRQYQFTENSFSSDECTKFAGKRTLVPKEILAALVKEGYLDHEHRLKDVFIKINKVGDFNPKFLAGRKKNIEGVYKALAKGLSQYASFIAKKELLDTKKYVESLGFEFKICQIYRDGTPSTQFDISSQDTSSQSSSSSLGKMQDYFEFGEKIYTKRLTHGDGACALHALNGEEQPNGLVEYFADEPNSQVAAKGEFLELLRESIETPIIRDKLVTFFENMFKDFGEKHASQESKELFSDFENTWEKERDEISAELKQRVSIRNEKIWDYLFSLSEEEAEPYFALLRPYDSDWKGTSDDDLIELIEEKGSQNVINGCLDDLLSMLPEELEGYLLSSEQEHIDKLHTQVDTFLTDKIKEKLDKLLDIYEEKLPQSSFYMSELELELAAILYGKKVLLLLMKEGDVSQPRYLNCEEGEDPDVVIVNEQDPDHYSQCHLVGA